MLFGLGRRDLRRRTAGCELPNACRPHTGRAGHALGRDRLGICAVLVAAHLCDALAPRTSQRHRIAAAGSAQGGTRTRTPLRTRDFKSLASTITPPERHCLTSHKRQSDRRRARGVVCRSTESGKRDSNPRPQPWQGCALPTELFPRAARRSIDAAGPANKLNALHLNPRAGARQPHVAGMTEPFGVARHHGRRSLA